MATTMDTMVPNLMPVDFYEGVNSALEFLDYLYKVGFFCFFLFCKRVVTFCKDICDNEFLLQVMEPWTLDNFDALLDVAVERVEKALEHSRQAGHNVRLRRNRMLLHDQFLFDRYVAFAYSNSPNDPLSEPFRRLARLVFCF